MRDGRIEEFEGRGFATLRTRRPITEDTVFRIGSITKPFTAVMLLQLVHAGAIRLSDPVDRFFPEIARVGGARRVATPATWKAKAEPFRQRLS